MAAALRPLLIDVGIPVGSYYLLRNAFGVSLWLSLALSSLGPAVRAIAGLLAERKLNLLAALMLAVNLTGIAVSFLAGDPRAMIAKDSIISSVIAFAILGSVVLRRPLMSAGLKPFMTRGEPRRTAAWDRLSAASPRFRRLELLFSTIWGLVLLAECAARLAGAYTLPVTTMVWLGTVMALGAIAVAGGTEEQDQRCAEVALLRGRGCLDEMHARNCQVKTLQLCVSKRIQSCSWATRAEPSFRGLVPLRT